MEGLQVLLTAGPTCEAIDPVRYITNHSSGKMGYQTALAALRRSSSVSRKRACPKTITQSAENSVPS